VLQILFCCSAWNNCSVNVHAEGCTRYDLVTHVLTYSRWSWLNTYDDVQHRYVEAIDSVHHLCSNIEPGIRTDHYTLLRVKCRLRVIVTSRTSAIRRCTNLTSCIRISSLIAALFYFTSFETSEIQLLLSQVFMLHRSLLT